MRGAAKTQGPSFDLRQRSLRRGAGIGARQPCGCGLGASGWPQAGERPGNLRAGKRRHHRHQPALRRAPRRAAGTGGVLPEAGGRAEEKIQRLAGLHPQRRHAAAEAHPARRIKAHAAFQRAPRMPAVRVQDGGRGNEALKNGGRAFSIPPPIGPSISVYHWSSVQADSDLPWFCFLGLRDIYLEDSISISGFDPVMLYGLRDMEGAGKFSSNSLYSMVSIPIRRLFELPLPAQGKSPILKLQVKVFFLHTRKLSTDQIGVLALKDAPRGIPAPGRSRMEKPRPTIGVLKKIVNVA